MERWVIVELLTAESMRLYGGRYDVLLHTEGKEFGPDKRIVDWGDGRACAAEFLRLELVASELKKVAEVMGS